MRIAIIGAGASGLVTARVLREVGHDVQVFDRTDDVGGVWSASRRYPGISTQDDRVSYAFSELPMPAHFPLHPSGAQIRSYFESYIDRFDLRPVLRLGTEVESIQGRPDGEWDLRLRASAGRTAATFDFVVMANGNFSVSHVPDWAGRAAFEAAGGVISPPSALGDGDALRDRQVLVVGWGKTACDIAAASAALAGTTRIAARVLRWKHPKRIGRLITFRHLLLTRLGEHLLSAPHTSFAGRALSRLDRPVREAVDRLLARTVAKQLDLDALGLRPHGPYADSNALVSEGFFEAVRERRLEVLREVSVESLGVRDGHPVALLSSGVAVRADVIVPATGYEQVLAPLSPEVQQHLVGSDGSLRLRRGVLPAAVPGLAFIGWMHSFHSPFTAEVQALWLAARLAAATPAAGEGEELTFALTHRRAASLGVQQLPSITFALLDTLLAEAGAPVSVVVRLRQLVGALDPSDYSGVLPRLRSRISRTTSPGRDGSEIVLEQTH